MSLIFFDRKRAMSGKGDTPVLKPEVETDEGMKTLQALAKDIKMALDQGSSSDLARALKAFFYQCDSMPHKEADHE
jgi:hypothetical protein